MLCSRHEDRYRGARKLIRARARYLMPDANTQPLKVRLFGQDILVQDRSLAAIVPIPRSPRVLFGGVGSGIGVSVGRGQIPKWRLRRERGL